MKIIATFPSQNIMIPGKKHFVNDLISQIQIFLGPNFKFCSKVSK